ncbi:magnesium transporter [Natranaerobius thermophilus]|uniref:Magnesium transporter MgtE n=1 Tax=Natranaerobius thermophilus (strain ATCC BAA-1301 / DSM 18059 / JW/NM-WN-LF) TaxID=457570 RepID=B2A3E9_NATTJ|nr:magnesium transporter [Natranaerobius thermophilus]ACB86378.1 magnesium transporter [Natranaerobius thermophilus JW/NM-WN-LF]
MEIFEKAQNYLHNKQMDDLKRLLIETEIHDIIQILKELSSEERIMVFRLLDKDRAIEIFELLDPSLQHDLVKSFTERKAIEVFSELDPDDQARLLDELPAKVTKRLLNSISKEEREDVMVLLGYEKGTAGRLMTPEYINVKKDQTVSEALERIRQKGYNEETIYTLYVTDNERKLEGDVSLSSLVLASPDTKVKELLRTDTAEVNTDTDQEEAARLLKDRDLLSLPVLDKEDRLVGIITIDDAMDVLEEEQTEDLFEQVGLTGVTGTTQQVESGRSLRMVEGSFLEIWRVRLPFLVITLIGGMLAGFVIESYEESLQAIHALAFFIPVIMDMGGNVGTQSSTIFARAVVLGHISLNRFIRHWLKEIAVGSSMGAMIGIAAGIIASVWQQIEGIGLVIGISLWATVTIATALGFLIPFILLKLDFDQAAGSMPVITTIKDISGLLIYFYVAAIFLGHLI